MEHARAESLYKDYFAGRLDRESVRALHAHFKDCEACRARMRLRRAGAESERVRRAADDPDLAGIQARVVGNRNLLIQILLLLVFAWFVWKMKR